MADHKKWEEPSDTPSNFPSNPDDAGVIPFPYQCDMSLPLLVVLKHCLRRGA